MLITDIVKLINARLAGDMEPFYKLQPHMDEVIDEINNELNSTFPTFSEFLISNPNGDYTLFPDQYLRTVVVYGAAYKWYVTDEEGIETAQKYEMKYNEHMFYMVRDFITDVPEEYQADQANGYYDPKPGLERGLWVPGLEELF